MRRSVSYVDRILKGANPSELPPQQQNKFESAINLKTANALGLIGSINRKGIVFKFLNEPPPIRSTEPFNSDQ